MLPLKKTIGTIAVIGPNADNVEVLLGNYNGFPSDPVTPLRGIREKVSKNTKVLYAQGCDWAHGIPSFEVIPSSALVTTDKGKKRNGLKGKYFNNTELKGEPNITRIDKSINFNWWDSSPDKTLDDDNFSIRWSGELVPPVSGTYALGGYGLSGFRLYIDNKPLVSFESVHEPSTKYEKIDMVAGKTYKVRLEYFQKQGDALIKLVWSVPGKDIEKEAVQAARQSDAVIMVMGLSPRLEGEEMDVQVKGFKGGDRLDLKLPDVQEELMQTIQGLGKPVVLVLLNGSAVAVNWASAHVSAIVEAWYPGQAAGTAIADVLFGDYNPAGRLPVTFYKSIDQLPLFEDYSMKGKTYRYFQGYPLYPFGYGLSYSQFEYGAMTIPAQVEVGKDVTVSVDVKNTGTFAGEEVVQVYVTDLEASVPVPIRSLAGFQRIFLKPGEKRSMSFTISPRQLSVIDKEYKRVIEPGKFEVSVGGKQPGFVGTADASTTGVVTKQFEIVGKVMSIN
jgi:beta-glucosidase